MDGLLDWYLLGLALGLGVAAGIPGLPREEGRGFAVGMVTVVAVASGVIAALAVVWAVFATLIGVAVGVFSYRKLARRAVPAASLAVAGLSLIPVLGYVVAAFSPVLGERLRRRAAGRYAGLRVLAKD
ncbi:MAG TPA: hypothetical protein VK896_01220 [Gaiellaceae bacterium]|nr:hypothetical protein [Gaiellaceae bacterium]